MFKLVFKTSFISFLLIFLIVQGSIVPGTKIQDQLQKVIKTPEESKSLKTSPCYGKVPLSFVPNKGQVDEKALFYAKASRYTLWLTKEGLVFDSVMKEKKDDKKSHLTHLIKRKKTEDITCKRDVSRMIFLNSKRNPEVIPLDYTKHKVNYFIGNDKSKWRTNIQTSRAVLYKELYRNIDFKIYGAEKQIEYDFVVKPGGEVADISFEYKDVEETRIDKEGNLVIETQFGEILHAKPVCYQEIEGEKIGIEAGFEKIEKNTYRFEVGEHNKNYKLTIDPLVLIYSTYLGGTDWDYASGIAVDSTGAVYVTGTTTSSDFPTLNPIQGYTWIDDIFISKINPEGTALVYSTYLGGGSDDWDSSIAVDSVGAAYVKGVTWSNDFPTHNPIQGNNAGLTDAFIVKISPSGTSLVYSTYIGGSGYEWWHSDIAVDQAGAAYISGSTESTDFPTQNPIQSGHAGGWDDAFITKISSSGNFLVYSTYLGGSDADYCFGITVDSEGSAYVTGWTFSADYPTKDPIQINNAGSEDVFITKINSSGTALVYSTFIGGSQLDWGGGIAVDPIGAAYVTGWTNSNDFPTQNPVQGSNAGPSDAFITKVAPAGTHLIYSTFLGGSSFEWDVNGIAVDSSGGAYVTGHTESTEFPTQNPIQSGHAGGDTDVFITKINSSGSAFVYSTYLGGHDDETGSSITVDAASNAYVTGDTWSTNFPIQDPLQGSNAGLVDAFIAKLSSTYSLTLEAGEGGTTSPKPGTHSYEAETKVTIEAVPDDGYRFSHWSGDVSGTDNPMKITMDSDKSVTANFIRQYTLTITSEPGGTTDPTPGTYTYDSGIEVTITATPENGYRFGGWSGDISSAENPITISMSSDISIKANFIRQYTLTLTSGPGGTTQPSPGIYVYDEGTDVTISCIPDTHCRFSHWSGDASGTSDPLTITMDSDKSITANFIRIIYAPQNFTGQKVLNRSLSQAEYINFLSWQANPNNVSIVKYRIYQVEGNAQSLLVELNASVFDYWHRGVEKEKQYTYALVAVNDEGREGDRALVTVQ